MALNATLPSTDQGSNVDDMYSSESLYFTLATTISARVRLYALFGGVVDTMSDDQFMCVLPTGIE